MTKFISKFICPKCGAHYGFGQEMFNTCCIEQYAIAWGAEHSPTPPPASERERRLADLLLDSFAWYVNAGEELNAASGVAEGGPASEGFDMQEAAADNAETTQPPSWSDEQAARIAEAMMNNDPLANVPPSDYEPIPSAHAADAVAARDREWLAAVEKVLDTALLSEGVAAVLLDSVLAEMKTK